MKIVITDGYTLNPGDLSWEPIYNLGEVKYYDRTAPHEVDERCAGAEIIVTNKTILPGEFIRKASSLKMIAVTATGYNVVDVAMAKERGIPVCNVPVYGTDSVAQHVFALLLALSNRIVEHTVAVKEGAWSRSPDWSFATSPLVELNGKIMGIVGLGRIGKRVAELAKVFGMEVIFFNKGKKYPGLKDVTLEQLFRASDVISLHCPLTVDNEGFVNSKLLATMKPTSFLINTARGALVNEQDLADALKSNILGGAALDVLCKEPPPPDHPLMECPNCIITPHNAWMSFEARKRLMEGTVQNVQGFLDAEVKNNVWE